MNRILLPSKQKKDLRNKIASIKVIYTLYIQIDTKTVSSKLAEKIHTSEFQKMVISNWLTFLLNKIYVQEICKPAGQLHTTQIKEQI